MSEADLDLAIERKVALQFECAGMADGGHWYFPSVAGQGRDCPRRVLKP